MSGIKQIEQRLSDVKLLQELTSTFEAIAAQNLAATRNRVLSARDFLDEAQQVYTDARQIYVTQNQLDPSAYDQQLRIGEDNGKDLVIVIAPNTKLYGSLPEQLLSTATEGIRQKQGCDVLVLGDVGVEYFARLKPPIQFESLEVADEDWTPQQVQGILAKVARYRQVTAYYNHFRTVLTADVIEASLTITAAASSENSKDPNDESQTENQKAEISNDKSQMTNKEENSKPQEMKAAGGRNPLQKWVEHVKHLPEGPDALFEPSLEEVLNFFETTILKTLLRQKVRESLLSRYAARMVAMDVATENAKTATKDLRRDLSRAKRRRANAKMLDNYSGMSIWKN
jgi:F-type H+-transporting ATPase subunit gamma